MKRTRPTAVIGLDRTRRMRLAVEARCDERTVAAVYGNHKVQSLSRMRVEEAARRLGYPTPRRNKAE